MSKMQKVKLAPGVEEDMLKAKFWIGNNNKNVVMTEKEINKFNQLVFKKAKEKRKEEEFCDLSNYPEMITKKRLYDLMEDYSLPEKIKEKDFYNKNSKKITKRYRGWIKRDKIAIAENKKEALSYFDNENFLVVTESRVETEPNPFDDKISNVLFQMGDKIPLVKNEDIPQSIPEDNGQAQSPEGAYVIWLPVKGENEKLKFKKALIARSNDLHEGYLSYTRENLLKQAYKLLGERYGWGGLYKRRDCSRFIMDIYRTVGIQIPRDAGFPQEEISAGKSYEFSGDLKERRKVLGKLEAGDPIYMKGHVMMYLGKEKGEHYLIHSGSGYGKYDNNGNHKGITVHGVFVMRAEQLMKSSEKTYLEAFRLAKKFLEDN